MTPIADIEVGQRYRLRTPARACEEEPELLRIASIETRYGITVHSVYITGPDRGCIVDDEELDPLREVEVLRD